MGPGDSQTWGLGVKGMWGLGEVGTQGCGDNWDSGTWDARTSELGDAWGVEDVVNKQHLTFALSL